MVRTAPTDGAARTLQGPRTNLQDVFGKTGKYATAPPNSTENMSSARAFQDDLIWHENQNVKTFRKRSRLPVYYQPVQLV